MRNKLFVVVAVVASLGCSTAIGQSDPIRVERLTPGMMLAYETMYPNETFACFEKALAELKTIDNGHRYLLTEDYNQGQIWLLPPGLEPGPEDRFFICTPRGLADTPEEIMSILAPGLF